MVVKHGAAGAVAHLCSRMKNESDVIDAMNAKHPLSGSYVVLSTAAAAHLSSTPADAEKLRNAGVTDATRWIVRPSGCVPVVVGPGDMKPCMRCTGEAPTRVLRDLLQSVSEGGEFRDEGVMGSSRAAGGGGGGGGDPRRWARCDVSQDAGAPAAAGVSGPAGAVCVLSELMKCKVFGHRRCMLSGCCQLRPCRGRCFHGRCCRASGGMTAQAGCNLNAFVRYHERLQLIPISADAAGKRRRKPSAKGSDSAAHKAKRARRGGKGGK